MAGILNFYGYDNGANFVLSQKQQLLSNQAKIDGVQNEKIEELESRQCSGAVISVNGKIGNVILDADDIGAATAEQGVKADTAYQKPSNGIPTSDLASGVQTSLGKADAAYQKPSNGIPATDLASGVQTSLGKADTAYQKPSNGIPKTDLASGVQTSLGKADTAIQEVKTINGNSIVGTGDINITSQTYVIDNTPTYDSNNLVTSGGVQKELALGAVWDVSEHNSLCGTTFESLSVILNSPNLDALIPTDVRKGGMTIKFVQTSDNNYVQFRYMPSDASTTATFTNVANWQGVDEEPTYGSKNLVESGGVFSQTHILEEAELTIDVTKVGYYIKNDGSAAALSGYTYKIYDVRDNSIVKIKFDNVNIGGVALWATYSQLDNEDISSSNAIRIKSWPSASLGQPCNETIILEQNENFIAICNDNKNYNENDVSGITSRGIKGQVEALSGVVQATKDVLDISESSVDESIIDYTPAGSTAISSGFYSCLNSLTLPDRAEDGILKEISVLTAPSSNTEFSIKLYKKIWSGGVITGFTEISNSTHTFTLSAGETSINVSSFGIVVPKDAIISINGLAKYAESGSGYMVWKGAIQSTMAGRFVMDVNYIIHLTKNDSARLLEDEERISALEERQSRDIFDVIKDANVAILGDSITWLGGDDCNGTRAGYEHKGWTEYFKNLLKPKTIHSYARSGATWSHTANTVYDITENTGSLSDDNVIYNQINRLIAAVSGGTQAVPDIIIIAAGTNDAWYPSARPNALSVDADTEFADTSGYITDAAVGTLTSIAAAMRYDIELIKTNYPNCQVFVTTPLQATAFTQAMCFNVGKVISDCAKYLSIECVDQGAKAGIYRAQENVQYLFTYDGTHTSVLGAKMVGQFLAYETMCKYRGTLNLT